MLLRLLLPLAVVVFLVGNAARILRFLRMPIPLRWELYPIPKGLRARQLYGGSYFEDADWWEKRQTSGHAGEAAFMAREILLLKSVREGFRELWLWSWLLHWGLYLYIAGTVAGAAASFAGAEALRTAVTAAYELACFAGVAGSTGLLLTRALHPRLRGFSSRATMFNLLLLAALFVSAIAVLLHRSPLLLFSISNLEHSPAVYAHTTLLGFFLAYLPFTHMTHAYMKFFTWHRVRWDDRPAIHDPRIAAALDINLSRTTTWAAPHLAGGSAASWSEVVADPGGRGGAKRA